MFVCVTVTRLPSPHLSCPSVGQVGQAYSSLMSSCSIYPVTTEYNYPNGLLAFTKRVIYPHGQRSRLTWTARFRLIEEVLDRTTASLNQFDMLNFIRRFN